MREFDNLIRGIEHSVECSEIEDLKALATRALNISDMKLGKTGRLAHFIHHYGNISRLDETIGNRDTVREGRRLLQPDRDRHNDVLRYLRDAVIALNRVCIERIVA